MYNVLEFVGVWCQIVRFVKLSALSNCPLCQIVRGVKLSVVKLSSVKLSVVLNCLQCPVSKCPIIQPWHHDTSHTYHGKPLGHTFQKIYDRVIPNSIKFEYIQIFSDTSIRSYHIHITFFDTNIFGY